MKNSHSRLVSSFTIGALLAAGLSSAFAQSKPIVITPPAVNNGSNWSRAPFPAARQFDDVKAPDAKPIDELGANSPVANIEPPTPAARVAIMQPAVSPAPSIIAADPGLLPTGRPVVSAAGTINAMTFAPTIRSAPMSSREQIIADIEARMKTSDTAMDSFRSSASQMSTDGRRTFKAADDDVKEKAAALKKSIRAARKANDAEWDNARAQLAADYEAYGNALVRVDAAAGVPPVGP